MATWPSHPSSGSSASAAPAVQAGSANAATAAPTFLYVSSDLQPRSPPMRVNVRALVDLSWKTVRWALETGYGSFMNHRTFLTGFTAGGPAGGPVGPLRDTDIVPSVFWVHRQVMPLGFRQHIPACVTTKHIVAAGRLAELEQQIHLHDDETQRRVYSDVVTYECPVEQLIQFQLQRDEMETEAAGLRDAVAKMAAVAERAPHASTVPMAQVEASKDPRVSHLASYAVPAATYVCTACRGGGHFRDACDLFERPTGPAGAPVMKFGANKMKKLV